MVNHLFFSIKEKSHSIKRKTILSAGVTCKFIINSMSQLGPYLIHVNAMLSSEMNLIGNAMSNFITFSRLIENLIGTNCVTRLLISSTRG